MTAFIRAAFLRRATKPGLAFSNTFRLAQSPQLQALTRSFSSLQSQAMQPAVFGIGPRQKAAMAAVNTKEKTMQVISITDLSRLTRAQLFSLLSQFQATLADLVVGAPEHQFATAMLANIRAALLQRGPAP